MKLMNCKKTRKLLSRYHDGELDAKQSYEVRRHLDFCTQCWAELESLSKLIVMTDEIRQMEIPTDHQQNAINNLASIIADKEQQQFDKHRWSWHKVFSPFALRLSPLTSWAVASVMIAILIVGLLLTTMPKGGAYAEVKEALAQARAARYIHAIGKLSESWVESGKFLISKSKIGDDDNITMDDCEAGKSYRYYKRLNKVFVYDNRLSSDRLTSEYILKEYKALIKGADTWSKTVGEFKGQKVDLYQATRTLEYEENPMQLQCWIDPVNKRILRMEWTVEGSEDEDLNSNWFEIDYPDDIPNPLFEVGVPKDAKFVDFQNSPEAKQLLKDYFQARKKWDNYRLVVLTGEGYGLQVTYHSDKKHRWETYDSFGQTFGRRPISTLQEAEQVMKEYYPRLIAVERNGSVIQYSQVENKLDTFFGSGWDAFRRYAFRNFHFMEGPRTLAEIIGEEERDGEHLIKVLQHRVEIYLTKDKNVEDVVFMSTAFWLNPDKDYLIHRAEGKYYYPFHPRTGKTIATPWETQIERYAQTKNGIWYPAVVVARDQQSAFDTQMVESRFTVLAFETGLELPDSLFPNKKQLKKMLPPNDGRKLLQEIIRQH